MNSKLTSVAMLGLASILSACAVGTDTTFEDLPDTSEDELSTSSRSYVTITADTRKCMAPLCGGYFVKDVNKTTAERYVSGLDFGPSNLDAVAVGKVLDALPSELVLRGRLGPKEKQHGTRTFLVYEAYRGMPGLAPAAADHFYSVKDRNPEIKCFAAPCPNDAATKLNTTSKTYFSAFDVADAAALFVDQDWLVDRVHKHGALVAAQIVNGQKYAAGYEKVLDVSQVFVRIDDATGPCPAFKLAACPDGQVWTYTRDADLCLLPDKCVEDGGCPSLQPPHCADGYTVSGWRIDAAKCMQLVCDPSFVTEQAQ